ncbi:hypothetical protein J8J19_24120, partial [Mycobacterium tuberculosis]|nr:hypothetical protein [Mycobacterium tuberculosis]
RMTTAVGQARVRGAGREVACVRQPLPAAREQALAMLILDELRRSAPLPLDLPMPADKRLRALCDRVMADPGPATSLD